MRQKYLYGIVPLLALAVPLLAQNAPPNPAKNYKRGKALLPEPYRMADSVAKLCRMTTPEENKQNEANPHFHYYAQVYVNPTGQATIGSYLKQRAGYEKESNTLKYFDKAKIERLEKKYLSQPPRFPVGTVLTKEKFNNPKGTGTPELLTVMVKREKGYNPACYDWEFLVIDGKAKRILERGKLARCQSCHSEKNYQHTDGVASLNFWGLSR